MKPNTLNNTVGNNMLCGPRDLGVHWPIRRAKTADPQFFLRPTLTSTPINLHLQPDFRATLWHSILFD
ncbi:hypothetical protein VN97_g1132 [Penicillium thymicola]|uniref:Uncharacterized protein n=1 Tax=Penicillium thymicola TaxID=293382 RepID=A0AAI9TRH7_PENTH|nr:hypothetical protein VN97_g1132 [Penicillium thymicola]